MLPHGHASRSELAASGKMGAMDSGSASPRVLVVDDDPDVLASLERGLRLSGFEVATAVDGAEALRSATETRPDAIVLDINMPAGDGFSVHERIKSLRGGVLEGVPIIYLTGERSPRVALSAKAHGAFALVHKPYDAASLVETVYSALADPPELRPIA